MSTPQAQNRTWFLPGPADFIFLFVLYVALAIKPEMIFFDGSTGWHLVSGNYIWQHLCVPRFDLISYTFTQKPWVAYEWLSDLIMAALVKLGGMSLLQVTVACVLGLLFLLLYRRCRDNGCNFILATALTIIGALVCAIHWLARPHLFTFFGIYIFATQMDRYYNGKISSRKLLISLCLCMLVWVNCHPGFLIGLGLISIYLASAIIEYCCLDQSKGNRVKTLFKALVLNLVATFCNPYGPALYVYISNYLFKTNAILGATDEFLSPIFHGKMQPALLEVLFASFVVGLVIKKTRISLPDLFSYLIFAYLSLSAQRNMALFVIIAVPITARLCSDTIFSSINGELYGQLKSHWQLLITKFELFNKSFTSSEKHYSSHLLAIIVSITLILMAINGGQIWGTHLFNFDFPEQTAPNKTLSKIKELRLPAKNGLALDNWGGIIRYKLDYPVFIDDRADFYGENFYSDYVVLIQTLPGWQKKLAEYHIDWVLLPHTNRLTFALSADNNWQIAEQDKASVLLVRKTKDISMPEKAHL